MKKLEYFLKPTQEELFDLLCGMYQEEAIARQGRYILVPGDAPIMLLAHMDTVHQEPVEHICKSPDGNILMSPQGIGGDDRCGIYALIKAHEISQVKPWLLFTCDEEVGGLGAEKFATEYSMGKLPQGLDELKLLVEIDRKGSKDAVYYDCGNPEFEAYITSKGFVTAFGSFSDISVIAPELGVAAVNLSSGYYNAHTLHEYINRKQLNTVIQKVVEIIADSVNPDFPKYDYIERVWKKYINFGEPMSSGYRYGIFGSKKELLESETVEENTPDDLPDSMIDMYCDLLECYSQNELEQFRKEYGNLIICQIYEADFGPLYSANDFEGKR